VFRGVLKNNVLQTRRGEDRNAWNYCAGVTWYVHIRLGEEKFAIVR